MKRRSSTRKKRANRSSSNQPFFQNKLEKEPFLSSEGGTNGFFSKRDSFIPAASDYNTTQVQRNRNENLSEGLQANLERSFGQGFSNVKIRLNSNEAIDLDARAFTRGDSIHFAPGAFSPNTENGKNVIGHEFAHVAQQRNAEVKPTSALGKGRHLNEDSGLESEADNYGKKAAKGEAIPQYQSQGSNKNSHQNAAHASSSVIQRIYQPIEQKAPANTMGIAKFIKLVEAEEQKYSVAEQRDTSVMITRIRKIFYGAKGWDDHLIRGVKNISSPYGKPKERERKRTDVAVPGPMNDFDMVDIETYPVDSKGKKPQIYLNQEVKLLDGKFIDMGHVFAGLDAYNNRHAASAPVFSSISIDNLGGVTWVGDLGSVLAEAQIHYINKGKPNKTQVQNIINEYAPAQDMLGNIDAYVIAQSYQISKTCNPNAPKISQILRHYYLGAGRTKYQSKRYQTFATAIGLQGWNGTTWSNLEERIVHFTDQVNDAAALYIGAGSRSWNPIGWGGAIIGMSMNAGARRYVVAFFNALKTKLIAETKKSK